MLARSRCPLGAPHTAHMRLLRQQFTEVTDFFDIPPQRFAHRFIPMLTYFGVAIAVLRDDLFAGLFPTIRESINNLLIVDAGCWQGINGA